MNPSIDPIASPSGPRSLSRRAVLGTALKLGTAALAVTAVGRVGASAQAMPQYRTTTALNFRSGPGLSHSVIAVIPAGTVVAHSGSSTNGFFHVVFNGTYGWAHRDYLVGPVGPGPNPPGDPAVIGSAVTTTALNLRSGPSTGHKILQVVAAGATVSITNSVQNGYRYIVQHSGPAGWVVDGGLRPASSPPPPSGETFTTTAALNLRAEPSTSAKVLLVMPAGAKVKATPNGSGSFRQVTYNGVTGWAHTSYLN